MTAVTYPSRRQFLRGGGSLSPFPLESLLLQDSACRRKSPQRLFFYFVPNGIHMPAWTPSSEGTDHDSTHPKAHRSAA